ncbi:sigma-70 family RNA polymerase sigma factor [Paenibacillus sp. J2TS4]|uniref:sigma-70 family RNA polymerase sigma factor n=1 Tax=Paenibacillus sp. J2TS4 TaxID=2807194 RepID=UPI001B158545|nr:sigma-70 family RNA polymerase sigma factor [Paenibacillus sp. J2TS4]GIP35502.1 positive control factor [Paenibacillus sp. J2TS4]
MERGIAEESLMWMSMEELKKSYQGTYRIIQQAHQNSQHAGEKKLLSEMLSDCLFVIEWIGSGRPPGNRRGIERRAAYQREKLVDPISMQAYVHKSTAGSPANLTDGQRAKLKTALSKLSDRERDCYVMAHGECFSYSEIAAMLQITKGSVAQYISRAQKKISQQIMMKEDNGPVGATTCHTIATYR